jgi:hypothetical protein
VPDLGAAEAGLEKTNINDGFQIQHAADLYERLYPVLEPSATRHRRERPMDVEAERHYAMIAQSVLDLLSVRFLIAEHPLPLPPRLERFGGDGSRCMGPNVWRNPTALPRAYVVPRAVADDGPGRTAASRLNAHDPRKAVVMSHDPLQGRDRQTFKPADWLSHDPDLVIVRVETNAPGLLVVGNTWMPGWTAVVDGLREPVLRGNHWQQVVPIPRPGRHEVVLRYQPPGLAAGTAITTASVIVWGGVGVVLLIRYARRPTWLGFPVTLTPVAATA